MGLKDNFFFQESLAKVDTVQGYSQTIDPALCSSQTQTEGPGEEVMVDRETQTGPANIDPLKLVPTPNNTSISDTLAATLSKKAQSSEVNPSIQNVTNLIGEGKSPNLGQQFEDNQIYQSETNENYAESTVLKEKYQALQGSVSDDINLINETELEKNRSFDEERNKQFEESSGDTMNMEEPVESPGDKKDVDEHLEVQNKDNDTIEITDDKENHQQETSGALKEMLIASSPSFMTGSKIENTSKFEKPHETCDTSGEIILFHKEDNYEVEEYNSDDGKMDNAEECATDFVTRSMKTKKLGNIVPLTTMNSGPKESHKSPEVMTARGFSFSRTGKLNSKGIYCRKSDFDLKYEPHFKRYDLFVLDTFGFTINVC